MRTSLRAAAQPFEGEVISFARGYTAMAVFAFAAGVFFANGAAMSFLANHGYEPPWATRTLGCVFAGVALVCFWEAWGSLVYRPRLVLGFASMQYLFGRRLAWEVRYTNLERVGRFTSPFLRAECLGLRLCQPELYDAACPWGKRGRAALRRRSGFDLALRLDHASEPPDLLVEVVLRCAHRYRLTGLAAMQTVQEQPDSA